MVCVIGKASRLTPMREELDGGLVVSTTIITRCAIGRVPPDRQRGGAQGGVRRGPSKDGCVTVGTYFCPEGPLAVL